MADDATDVQSEITLEDFKADESEATEPSPVKAEAKSQDKAEPKAEAEDTKEETKLPDVPTKTETEDQKVEETETEDKPEEKPQIDKPETQPTKAEERKAQLNTEIRDLVAQKNALKTEVEKANAQVYQPATEDELVEGGMPAIEAKVEAMRQEREMEKFNEQVANAQLTIASESDRVLRDFPIFDSASENFDKELAEAAAEHLNSMLVVDPNTEQVIGVNGSVYKYYQTLARASGISAAKGQMQGQKNAEQMLANADSGASAAPEKKPEDPLMALWKSDD